MNTTRRPSISRAWTLAFSTLMVLIGSLPAFAQEKKPNILFIMGDDIGWMQVGLYHEGIGIGENTEH